MNAKQLSDLISDMLSTIQDDGENNTEVVLSMPTTKSKFPCRVIDPPLESVIKSHNAEPIVKDFQVSIEHWASKQRECMAMAALTDEQMKTKNFVRTATSKSMLDEITKKYRLITTYENRYYSINNSFEVIR